jgi:hypothetical protein
MSRRGLRMLLCVAVCLALFPRPGFGQGNAYGKPKNQREDQRDDEERDRNRDHDRDDDRQPRISIVFSSRDRDIIRDYYHNRYSNLPPGLAKRDGNLPPGLQKHLERDGTLPPGLQKRLTPFPDDLERQLPRLPSIYRRGTIGVDVVILDRRTQRIVDIVHDILRP